MCINSEMSHWVCHCFHFVLSYAFHDRALLLFLGTETLYCLTYGDPHYRTFDGLHFDFMGECSYYLFRGCEDDFVVSVIQVNERLGSIPYTAMKELIINYFSVVRIELSIGRLHNHC